MAKGKRKLLAADSDDDEIPVRPLRRTGRTQTSATPEPTPAATATRIRRGRTTTPSESEEVPPVKPTRGRKKTVAAIPSIFEDEEEEPEVQMVTPSGATSGTRRGTRAGTSRTATVLGESTQAEDFMPLRSSSTVAPPTLAASGTGTGRANRKRMILASDDDDLVSGGGFQSGSDRHGWSADGCIFRCVSLVRSSLVNGAKQPILAKKRKKH